MMQNYITGLVTNFHNMCEKQLSRMNTRFLAGNKITIVDFVMCSYIANVVFNMNGPFSAVTKSILGGTPLFGDYCDTILQEFKS